MSFFVSFSPSSFRGKTVNISANCLIILLFWTPSSLLFSADSGALWPLRSSPGWQLWVCIRSSLRSKRFRRVSEQKSSKNGIFEVLAAQKMGREQFCPAKNENLVLRTFLLWDPTEMLATHASVSSLPLPLPPLSFFALAPFLARNFENPFLRTFFALKPYRNAYYAS